MRIAFLTLLATWLSPAGEAKFRSYETEQVPIERVFAGLEARLGAAPDDFEVHYQLARLHAMAAFKDVAAVPVIKGDKRSDQGGQVLHGEPGSDTGTPEASHYRQPQTTAVNATGKFATIHLAAALRHFDRALVLLKKDPEAPKKAWLIKPLHLGQAWCLDKAGRRDDALTAYRQALAISWHMEMADDFKVEDWSKGVRYATPEPSEAEPPKADARFGFVGPGVCFSEECAGYLLALLDPQKDAAEIRGLKALQKRLERMPRAVTPILIPLVDEPFEALVDHAAQVPFDLDGSGVRRRWEWLTPKAAWLVFDGKQTGQITSGLQMFGSVTFWIFWRDGYQALGSLDANGDGLINGAELDGLALWQDLNGNGISEPGEVKPIAAYGIDQLSCRGEAVGPGLRLSRQGVRFIDGTVRPSYDWDAPMCAPAAAK